MAFKADSVSTLGYHWTDHAGKPLEPQDYAGIPHALSTVFYYVTTGEKINESIHIKHENRLRIVGNMNEYGNMEVILTFPKNHEFFTIYKNTFYQSYQY